MAMDKLNNYPRKCHGMKSPNQIFESPHLLH